MKQAINKRKFIGLIAGVMSISILLTMSFAFFSDRDFVNLVMPTSQFDIYLDTSNIIIADINGTVFFTPGDIRKLNYSVNNVGQASADIRETLKITIPPNLTFAGNATTQSEFDIYSFSDVEVVNGSYVPKTGTTPIPVKSIKSNVITYSLPEYVLSGGNKNVNVEIETGKAATETHDYVLLFNKSAGNELQMKNINCDILVEAKQHRNTNGSWLEISKHDFTFNGSGETIQVVDSLMDNKLSVLRNGFPLFMEGTDMNTVNCYISKDFPVTLTAKRTYLDKPVTINSVSAELIDCVLISGNTLSLKPDAVLLTPKNGTANISIEGKSYTIKVSVA